MIKSTNYNAPFSFLNIVSTQKNSYLKKTIKCQKDITKNSKL